MGSCASTQKNPSCLVVVSRFGLGNKSKRVFDPSPATENHLHPVDGRDLVGGVDLKEKALELGLGCRSPGFGSKEEEVFFESRAWLDSDCEDDFFSVNGDLMPSRGSTPNHQLSALMRPPAANNGQFADKFPDSKSEPSPTGRKRLAELFCETSQRESTVGSQNAVEERILENGEDDAHSITNCGRPEKSLDGTPHISDASSDRSSDATPSREERSKREKTWNTIRCCLPSLVPNFNFDEKGEKMSSGPCVLPKISL